MSGLTSIELATGILLGRVPGTPPPLPEARAGETPFEVLQRVCVPALERGTCFVSFSGGRDSSLVLAAAASAARRNGLPLPVPVTNRFEAAGHTDESDWQELVITHLRIREWVRLDLTDELDVLGDLATRGLRRHGLLWPFNAHFHSPVFDLAAGGSVLTGIGGDEALGSSRWARSMSVLTGLQRPRPRDMRGLALICAPRPLRREVIARQAPEPFTWLRPFAARQLVRAWAADQAKEPARLGVRLRRLQVRRALREGLRSLDLLAADASASVAHPLLDPRFLAALATAGGSQGWTDRSEAMRALFDGALPASLLSRTSKARFEGAFWGSHSRRFASKWSGERADSQVIDASALKRVWAESEPDAHTYLLMQAAWLDCQDSARLDHRPVREAAIRA